MDMKEETEDANVCWLQKIFSKTPQDELGEALPSLIFCKPPRAGNFASQTFYDARFRTRGLSSSPFFTST